MRPATHDSPDRVGRDVTPSDNNPSYLDKKEPMLYLVGKPLEAGGEASQEATG